MTCMQLLIGADRVHAATQPCFSCQQAACTDSHRILTDRSGELAACTQVISNSLAEALQLVKFLERSQTELSLYD
jgi:hypothetical protein